MPAIVVVYCSQTGFTERYARWLADELGTEAVPLDRCAPGLLAAADQVVFLSWFHAGSIKHAKWLRAQMAACPGKGFTCVGVGAFPSPEELGRQAEEEVEATFERAFPRERFPGLARFYCRGGFDFDRLCLADKVMMRAFFRMNAKKAAEDEQVAQAMAQLREGFDATDRAQLGPVIAHLGGGERSQG